MRRRRLIVGASALVLAGALGSCSADDEQPAPAAGSALSSTTSLPSSTSSAPSQPLVSTTATTAAIPGGCPSGVGVAAQNAPQAARCLFQAWEQDNRARAATFASLDVVEALFRERWAAPAGAFQGCAPQSGTEGQLCTINHRGTPYRFDVRRSEGGWRVTQLRR